MVVDLVVDFLPNLLNCTTAWPYQRNSVQNLKKSYLYLRRGNYLVKLSS